MDRKLKKQITAAALELRRQGKTWNEMYPILETQLSIPNLRDLVKLQSSGTYTKDGVQKPQAANRQTIRVKKNRNEAKRSSILKSLSEEEIIDFGRRNGYSSEDIRRAIARERRAKAAQNKYQKQMGVELDHKVPQAKGSRAEWWDSLNPGDASQAKRPMDPDLNRKQSNKHYRGEERGKLTRSSAIKSLFDWDTPLEGEKLPTYKPPKTKPKPKGKSLLRSPSGTVSGNKNLRRLGIPVPNSTTSNLSKLGKVKEVLGPASKLLLPVTAALAFREGGAEAAAIEVVDAVTPIGLESRAVGDSTIEGWERSQAQVKAERDANLARKNRVTPQKKQQQLRRRQPANPALQKAKNAITSALGWLMPD